MLASKVSKKGQITLPSEVRQALGARPGDLIRFGIAHGVVTIHRVDSIERGYYDGLAGTLAEWGSIEDDHAFHDL
jgi:AbrB family looped-hinge helix DNA binding protein